MLRDKYVDVVPVSLVPAVQLVCNVMFAAGGALEWVGGFVGVLQPLDKIPRILT